MTGHTQRARKIAAKPHRLIFPDPATHFPPLPPRDLFMILALPDTARSPDRIRSRLLILAGCYPRPHLMQVPVMSGLIAPQVPQLQRAR
jgi:hypothetical protein